jgi:hypothetical protein
MDVPSSIDDLKVLIKNKAQEDLHLDYKDRRAISEDKRHEIAKDVSAFANSDGGIIIYGIREAKHLPVEIDEGIDHNKFSREWLEQVIQSNISPRIDGLRINQIPISTETSAFAVLIPKSYRSPHQERSSKRYYKRYNFKSEPMEDYEITDIRNRMSMAKPLVNFDVQIKHGIRIYLVIENIGQIAAENVTFEFSPQLVWGNLGQMPPLLNRGIKRLPPGRKFHIMYHSFPEVFAKEDVIPHKFDVTVGYYHPEIVQQVSDTFHIDLEDYMQTSVIQSEIYEQGRNIENTLKEVVREVNKLNESLSKLSSIAGPTGLDLSATTVRNIGHLLSGDGLIEKIDPTRCDYSVFEEVLGINDELAYRIWSYFRHNDSSKSLSEIKGMTEELIKKFNQHFIVKSA